MEEKVRKKKLKRTRRKVSGETDIALVFTIIFLIVFGVIMVYSSSYYASMTAYGNHVGYLKKQLQWSCVGLLAMFVVSRIPYGWIAGFSPLIYLGSVLLQVLVLIVGDSRKGAVRWFEIGGISFQPSEYSKVALIIVLSVLLSRMYRVLDKWRAVLMILIVLALPAGLIMKENLSAGIILCAIGAGMIFVAMPNWKAAIKIYWAPVLILLAGIFSARKIYMFIGSFLADYQMARLKIFFEGPWTDPTKLGYQTIQSLYAIGSGGWFGKGLGYSMQKNGFIPEAHNDIIFSVICEELGVFGAAAIILLFMILLNRCMHVAAGAKDMLGTLIAAGVMVQLGVQVIMNIAVVTNSMPNTGVTMPFISYGGSAMLFLMVEMGMVLNVAKSGRKPSVAVDDRDSGVEA